MDNFGELDVRGRLTREAWLVKALEVLSTQGDAKLHISALSQALGVSKGSFYWHFEDRADFIRALVDYWGEFFTRRVKEGAESSGGSPEEKLLFILRMVTREDLTVHDAIFDAWAAHEAEIMESVREVHRFRHCYVRSLFAELGFEGSELALRTQAFMGFLKYRSAKSLNLKSLQNPGTLANQLAFFTAPRK